MKRTRRRRRWEGLEDDPGAGLLNLFDVWIAFSVALLLALVSYLNLPSATAGAEVTRVEDPGGANMELLMKQGIKMDRYRMTRQSLSGEGTRLGTAYRLKSGEVVYVPE